MEHLEFDSIKAMGAYLAGTERLPEAGQFSIRTQSERECPMSWDEAMRLAADGGYWADGAERMVKGVADAAALRENYTQPMLTHDVAGFMPDVPAYLAGVPDNMLAYEAGDLTTATMPTVTIGVGTFSYGVDSHAVLNRGIAILSLIDAIESVGYRVQLDFCGDSTTGPLKSMKRIRCVLKRAQDQWNPGSVAFGTAHAGMLRRLTVACLERDPDTVERTQGSYGRGDNGYIEEYSIAFEYMTSNRGYDTLEDALASVEKLGQDFGLDVNLTGGA
jgi:hypothetical protein